MGGWDSREFNEGMSGSLVGLWRIRNVEGGFPRRSGWDKGTVELWLIGEGT